MAVRSKAWTCSCPFLGIAGSKPAGWHGCMSVVSVVCCQIEVFVTEHSLVVCVWLCVGLCPLECDQVQQKHTS
jgi:hypothetical protein